MTDFYSNSSDPANDSDLDSSVIRAEFAAIALGFTKLAGYTGVGNRVLHVNAGGTGYTNTAGFTFDGTTLVVPALSVTGNAAVNGSALTTTTATFALLNTGATTINAFGAATTLNLGAATGTLTVANTTLAAKAITASTTLGVTGVATFTAQPIMSSLTASLPVFSDGSKGLVSNAMTGTGNVVMSVSPTLTGTLTAAIANFSGLVTASAGLTVPTGQALTLAGTASLTVAALTATRVLFAGAAGLVSDSSALTYVSGTGILTATGFAGALNGSVGQSAPAAGSFTTVSASGELTVSTGATGLGLEVTSSNAAPYTIWRNTAAIAATNVIQRLWYLADSAGQSNYGYEEIKSSTTATNSKVATYKLFLQDGSGGNTAVFTLAGAAATFTGSLTAGAISGTTGTFSGVLSVSASVHRSISFAVDGAECAAFTVGNGNNQRGGIWATDNYGANLTTGIAIKASDSAGTLSTVADFSATGLSVTGTLGATGKVFTGDSLGGINVNNGASLTLLSVASASCYLVTATSGNFAGYMSSVVAFVPETSTTMTVTKIGESNSGFVISASGQNLILTNTLGGAVSVKWSYVRLY